MLKASGDASPFAGLRAAERVIVALDCGADEALTLARSLKGAATWMKVGMTLYYAQGPSIVAALKDEGFKVFLDLKFHDIPHQVEGAAAAAASSGADMLTMHALGGPDMMRAAVRGAGAAATQKGSPMPVTLGITVLTSMDEATLAAVGIAAPLAEEVLMLARDAQEAGLSGVVASPQEAAILREQLGACAYIVTPGVRPAGAALGDQSRVATPAAALAAGASHVVIGRPITQAADPALAFAAIVADMEK
ncbi:MAG: orotidine-5'-phosphate decarboxylase [Coriobacteriaceae bacterium]|jgi:orotidine-5'-phosphate decarboxylase|nr:orotidine-5'-phosphate decarboxylase [Coriobacteriaceae bacterium]